MRAAAVRTSATALPPTALVCVTAWVPCTGRTKDLEGRPGGGTASSGAPQGRVGRRKHGACATAQGLVQRRVTGPVTRCRRRASPGIRTASKAQLTETRRPGPLGYGIGWPETIRASPCAAATTSTTVLNDVPEQSGRTFRSHQWRPGAEQHCCPPRLYIVAVSEGSGAGTRSGRAAANLRPPMHGYSRGYLRSRAVRFDPVRNGIRTSP